MRRRLVVVWSLLALLAGAIVALEVGDVFEIAPPPPTGTLPVFDFAEPELGAVDLVYQGRFAALMRAADGGWFRHDAGHSHGGPGETAPVPEEAHVSEPGRAEAIRRQLEVTARMTADRRVVPEHALEAYGLARPQVMLAFYPRAPGGTDLTRPLSVLYVGDLLPSGFAYYARREGERDLLLIPRYQIALLLALAYGAEQAPSPLPARPPAGE